jgi:hypothetical protein
MTIAWPARTMRAMLRYVPCFPFLPCLLLLCGCSSPDEAPFVEKLPPSPLPPLGEAPLTTEVTILPAHPIIQALSDRNPAIPEQRAALLTDGFGEVMLAPGEPVVPRTMDGGDPPEAGPSPALLTRFVFLADIQLADDESPARLAALDTPAISSAFRPQEGHGCHVLNAAVRTVNRLAEDLPIDFVVLGGDNIDNAQQNEHDWVRAILEGADVVECDSGADDDPMPGPDNDPKDALVAEGLTVPWLWVMGNHDILRQGISPIQGREDEPVGNWSTAGTRDWALPGGPVVKGEVIPDAMRAFLDVPTILEQLSDHGDGHGIDQEVVARGKASYVHDIAGTPIRLLVVDTATPIGSADGVILQSDIDAFIAPALDQAAAEDKLVIVTSHHGSASLTDGGGVGGSVQPGAVLPEAWRAFLGQYDNVLMHLAGHSHVHRVTLREPPGGHPYWEVLSSALADHPHQLRLVEIWDQDNGALSIRLVGLDYAVEGDPVAAEGRALGVLDLTSGWVGEASGTFTDRNVELWFGP